MPNWLFRILVIDDTSGDFVRVTLWAHFLTKLPGYFARGSHLFFY